MKRSIIAAGLAVLIATTSARGADEKKDAAAAKPTPPPPEVSYITVEPQSVTAVYEFVGVTQPSREVEIRSRVEGFLKSRNFEEGTLVQKGDLLYTIEPESFEADLAVAQAQVEQAEALLKWADLEAERLLSLKASKAVSQNEIDEKVTARNGAAATLRLAQAHHAKAQLELGYTTMSAPLTGVIGKTGRDTGSYVDNGENSLLTTISQIDPIYVSYRMSEREFLENRQEYRERAVVLENSLHPYLEITFVDGTIYEETGTINFKNPKVDLMTGTLEFRAEFPNPNRRLMPGQYVKARVMGWSRPNAIAVPLRAINQSPSGSFVYVIGDENKAEMRTVELGTWSDKDWIVKDGLRAGERVIVDGVIKVQPGVTVNATPYSAAAAIKSETGVVTVPKAKA